MKSMLLIAHPFHQKTRSYEFLLRLFEPAFKITLCHADPVNSARSEEMEAYAGQRFDVLVCWQILPSRRQLQTIPCSNRVFFPMYDQSGGWGIEDWYSVRDFRIVSFSRTLYEKLRRWGFDAHGFQFFPPPAESPEWGDPRRCFFWYRTEGIHLGTVATLLWKSEIRKIHLHRSPDPGHVFREPSPEVLERFAFTWSEWFEDKRQMEGKVSESAVYVAPRLFEGIGMSFLEAMAKGRCVLAPDHPTMNEYITHGRTGLLYDPQQPAPLDLPDVPRIQREALAFMREGYARWEREKDGILPLVEAPPSAVSWKPLAHLLLRFLLHPMETSRHWRSDLLSVRIRKHGWRVKILGRIWAGSWNRTHS